MRYLSLLLFVLVGGLSLSAQDFMLQGWYWDYDKDGCNGYSGPNWAARLNSDAAALETAGFTYVWLPPASRSSFGACSNGYDPKDLYDLGEYGLGRTGFGTRAQVNTLISTLNARGMEAVADVVYNHRDGGTAEDNPAVKAYIEQHYDASKNPFPSDRYRIRLPLGGTYGSGDYYFKVSSKTTDSRFVQNGNQYKFYVTTASNTQPFQGAVNESEPNGGGDCGQAFDDVMLNQDMVASLANFDNCFTDEFHLDLNAGDFAAGGDDLLIFMNNSGGGYSDHRIYGVYYQPDNGSPGFNIDLNDLKIQTYTDFTNLPSGQGAMNFENFRPNSANTNGTGLNGDEETLLFFYDVVQANPSTRQVYADWNEWLFNDVGFGGLRMDAVKHFPPYFVGQLLDDLSADGIEPGMVVGEFFDGNAQKLAGWVNAVNANMFASSARARVFDFALRDALKSRCDFGGDARNIFNNSLRDATNLSGFDVVTFVNNHDFRSNNEPIQNDALLAYAYILTNNQLGVPTVFYPDFFGTSIPNAPTQDLSAEIGQLMQIHRDHIFGATTVEYLNNYGTPYTGNYSSGSGSEALIYQLRGGVGSPEVVVAINFSDNSLRVDQQIATAGARNAADINFTELTGNGSDATLSNGFLDIAVGPHSYAIYALGTALPSDLLSFTAEREKRAVHLNWTTANEVDLADYRLEASPDGRTFHEIARLTPGRSAYAHTDRTPWSGDRKFYRLRTVDLDGSESLSEVRLVTLAEEGTCAAA